MATFQPARDQDAGPTIRGFLYQIKLTIVRWLDLVDGEILYLECGEDIDRVLAAEDSESVSRELEQVKIRGRPLTLHSPEILIALSNFASHLQSNPDTCLRFRFTSTAEIGRERGSPLTNAPRAIEAWRQLQNAPTWADAENEVASRLAKLICASSRPARCSKSAWNALTGLAAGKAATSFQTFVRSVEWSCGSIGPDALDYAIHTQLGVLCGSGHRDAQTPQQVYDRLLFHVIQLLARKGEKTLTPSTLKNELAKPILTEINRKRIQVLEAVVSTQAGSIERLQTQAFSHSILQAMPVFFGNVTSSASTFSLSQALHGPPPLVSTLACRNDIVDAIVNKIDEPCLVWLHGDYGVGKSQLARLLADRLGGPILGVDMQGLSEASAMLGLDAFLTDPRTSITLESTQRGVVLLDNLPDCEPQSRFETVLSICARTCLSITHTVIVSSHRPPSTAIRSQLGVKVQSFHVPPFSDSEARDLLCAHGIAGVSLSDIQVTHINSTCNGHPMLLAAFAQHLQANNHDTSKALLDAIVSRSHRWRLDLDTAQVVLKTVASKPCRDLLFRLASARAALSIEEIRRVATLPPSLREPSACLRTLEGPWLRQTSASRFEASPLAMTLGSELAENQKIALHRLVARLLLERKTLSLVDFYNAVSSLFIAHEYSTAAVALIHGCMISPKTPSSYSSLGVLFFFPPSGSAELPPEIELPLRALQVIAASADDTDDMPYFSRLQLLAHTSPASAATGAVIAGMLLLTSRPDLSMPVVLLGAAMLERHWRSPAMPAELFQDTSSVSPEAHLLLPVLSIRSCDDLDMYVEMLEQLSASRRSRLLATDEMKHGSQSLMWRPLFKSTGKIDPSALTRLTLLETKLLRMGAPRLAAYAAAGRLVKAGEYDRDIDDLRRSATELRSVFADHPDAMSVIEAIYGQQLYFLKHSEEAISHLSLALADPSHIVGLERANRLADALCAEWQLDRISNKYTDALEAMLADQHSITPIESRCQFHSQIALARWRQDRKNDAFDHFERATVSLLDLEEGPRARHLGSALGHAVSYCYAIAETGSPPLMAADGGPFATPDPGMFLGLNEQMAKFWRRQQGRTLLQWLLARLANSINCSEAHAVWASRALEAAEHSRNASILMLLTPQSVVAALRNGDWLDALDAACVHGRSRLFVETRRPSSSDEDSIEFDPSDNSWAGALRTKSEHYSLSLLSHLLVPTLSSQVLALPRSSAIFISLAEAIEQQSSVAELTIHWRSLSQAIRQVGSNMLSDQDFRTMLSSRDDASRCANFISHGLVSLRSDIPLPQAAVSQLSVLRQLAGIANALEVSLSDHCRAICQYWSQAISRAAFQFSTPRLLQQEFDELSKIPNVLWRTRRVLSSVLLSLNVSVADDDRDWLTHE